MLYLRALTIKYHIPQRETRVPSFPHTVKHIFKHMHGQESCRSILTFPEACVNNHCRQSCQHRLITMAFTIFNPHSSYNENVAFNIL